MDDDGRAERRLRTRISTICGVVAFASAIVISDPFRLWVTQRADPLIVIILFLAAAAFLGLASFDVLRAMK